MNSTLTLPAPRSAPASLPGTAGAPSATDYNIPLGLLRAFVTALVVAHHAVLAYHPWVPPAPVSLVAQPRWWEAFPVVDAQRWTGWALFVGWNDTFFMALMFLLSGLFVWNSLQRKGSGGFLRGRLLRLGVPFILAAAFLAPLAYFPAYLQSPAPHTLAGFWGQWRALGNWPAGPAWFIWVLLAFGGAAALAYQIAPQWAESLRRIFRGLLRRPIACSGALVLVSAMAYVPMAAVCDPLDWRTWGPFSFQTSRIFLYAVYFTAGIVFGAGPAEGTLLSPEGPLARRWLLWLVAAIVAFVISTVTAIMAVSNPAATGMALACNFVFPIACGAWIFALLSLFLRFARARGPLIGSFTAAAYGIYLIHYPVVSWAQYALLSWPLPGFLKGALVTVTGLAVSWVLVAALRRNRGIAGVI